MNRLESINYLPLPLSLEDIYNTIPENMRLSGGYSGTIRNNVNKEYLAILDWFNYKSVLLSRSVRDEVFFSMKDDENLKGFLTFLNIPYPDTIGRNALLRINKNVEKIWKYKNTLNSLYLYLKSLFGDFFYCEIFIEVIQIKIFSYYNNLVDNTGYYTSPKLTDQSTSYLIANPDDFPIYTVKIDLYSKVTDIEIAYIRSILPFFIIFFRDTGKNVLIRKLFN